VTDRYQTKKIFLHRLFAADKPQSFRPSVEAPAVGAAAQAIAANSWQLVA